MQTISFTDRPAHRLLVNYENNTIKMIIHINRLLLIPSVAGVIASLLLPVVLLYVVRILTCLPGMFMYGV